MHRFVIAAATTLLLSGCSALLRVDFIRPSTGAMTSCGATHGWGWAATRQAWRRIDTCIWQARKDGYVVAPSTPADIRAEAERAGR
ncbi:hypothetical protein [Methylopila sp. 73B]|uniref:hypothetical protein n=1 Tax=Methylopila sp. 73B TaxID=1120792 RepID=UPI0012DDBC35|nr:hypothetical protein [Methylopila sp. 73B]